MEKRTPFDIKYRSEIECGKYLVVTRDNRPVRVLCWDKKDYYHYPVIALVQDMGYEVIGTYSEEGKYGYDERKSTLDLFLVANPDYTEPTAESEPTAEPFVDWDAFRREAAKDFVAACYTNQNYDRRSGGCIAEIALKQADELIKQLKENKK